MLEFGDALCESLGEGDAAPLQADEHDVVGAVVALDDLVGHAAEDAPHVVGGQEQTLAGQEKTSRAGLRGFWVATRLSGGKPRRCPAPPLTFPASRDWT